MQPALWAKIALAAITASACVPAWAAPLEVSPITTELAAGRMASTITVTNHGKANAAVQLRAYAWTQNGTEDALTRTDDLVVSPPMFQLAPEDSQIVRLMLRRPVGGTEASYRVLLDELPAGKEPGAVQFAVRLSLPVFAAPAGQGASNLAWRVVPSSRGVELRVTNRGNRRDRVADLAVALPGGAGVRPVGLQNPYVLPGVERRFRLPIDQGAVRGGQLAVTGVQDNGRISVQAPVQPEP